MIEETQSDDQDERTRLNRIADEKSAEDLPEHTSWDEITAICETLYEQLEEVIANHVAETTLTRREAEVWVLTNFYGANYALLTDEAIELALTAPESPFGADHDRASDSDRDDSLTATTVKECYERADDKYTEARKFVGITTFRNRDECLDEPTIAWLDRATEWRIKRRVKEGDTTLDDVVTRLLDETETRRSLEELTRRYLEARGKDNVAQVAVNQPAPESGTLSLTAHTGIRDELPAVIKETDAIVIDGQQYDFRFTEDPYGPHEGLGRVSLYAADNILGMEAVQIDDGIEAARDRFQDAAAEADGGQR